jgi:fructose-bisphosphate aldolase / 2-amino-3,7-dideoxy-D-threo-hept-6-ulosonate synthase
MHAGKQLRLRRIIDGVTGTSVMFAFSHGTSAPTVMSGLEHPEQMVGAAARGGATCVFVGVGMASAVAPAVREHPGLGLVAKVTATASRGEPKYQEVATATVEYALRCGFDGVVALLPFAPENEPEVIAITGSLGEQCDRYGMPFVAEAEYPNAYYGEANFAEDWGLPYLKRSARLCTELGADIIKSNWTGSAESFAEIVDAVPVPVVVAGGSKESPLDLLQKLAQARSAGAIGCSVGRNVFQSPDPAAMLSAIRSVVSEGVSPEQANQSLLVESV